jgi:catalase-peroxidase
MKVDPIYREICQKFLADPDAFGEAFAKAWFKLLHRDMGPKSNYVAGDYKDVEYIWQDPIPFGKTLSSNEENEVRKAISGSGIDNTFLIETAWASASTFRGSDNRGGANGARIRLAPQKDWAVNQPKQLAKVLSVYENISAETGASIADIIVIGGAVGIENLSGTKVEVATGRGDATQENTDVSSFELLKPSACGFRNYIEKEFSVSPEELLLDKAQLLGLSPVELTVLVGGMRAMGISQSGAGLWGDGKLSNQWFKQLLSMDRKWEPNGFNAFKGVNRNSRESLIGSASRIDLLFGSNSELRAIAEVYAQNDNKYKFISDFISAWNKVMNADRFDL